MKTIYIPVSDRPECVVALQQGFTLGQQLSASIIGCHIRSHSDSAVNLPAETKDSDLYTESYDLAWENALAEKSEGNDSVKAQLLFDKMAQQFDYKLCKKSSGSACAMWTEKVGSPDRLFSIFGPVSDLIVVSRPAKKGRSVANTIMLGAVLNAAAPVLILPQSGSTNTLGQRIAIAWNQSPEAALAVKAALPLLQTAKEVNIITNGAENRPGPKAKHLAKYLAFWGINTNHIKEKESNDSVALMQAYKTSQSDLLVMGGYSRSRFRQQLFGGVTQYMLHEAKIPVFMLHT